MISPFDVRDPVAWLPLWFLCFSPHFREWGQPGEKLLLNLSCCFPPGRCSLMRQLSKLRQSAQGSLVGSAGLPCGLVWMIITSGLVRMVIPSGLVWMVIPFGLVRMVILPGLVCIVITSELVRMVIPSELVCMVFTSGLLWMVITSGLIWMPISPSDSSGMFFSNISWKTHLKTCAARPHWATSCYDTSSLKKFCSFSFTYKINDIWLPFMTLLSLLITMKRWAKHNTPSESPRLS